LFLKKILFVLKKFKKITKTKKFKIKEI